MGERNGDDDAPASDSTPSSDDHLFARSFVVRALRERDGTGPAEWRGLVTDVASGTREAWRRPRDVARFIGRQLQAGAASSDHVGEWAETMVAPALTDVVSDMLGRLGTRLPLPRPALPTPNITLERVSERLVGLGNHRGGEDASPLGVRTLRGGRLEARVRFQLWGTSATEVDDAVLALHTDLLDDRDELRLDGFLKLSGADTTVAEHLETVGWRKTSSFDVLYEYQYVDADDAQSLIVRIPVTSDTEHRDSPAQETTALRDHIVRWDEELAEPLAVSGPLTVHRISAMVHEPGPALGGTVTLLRSVVDGPGPVAHHADLDTFLVAVGGSAPAQTEADVTLATGDLLAALGPTGEGLELGDLAADGTPDVYAGFDRGVSPGVVLATSADRLTLAYTPPPGTGNGLDQAAVVYLQVNAP